MSALGERADSGRAAKQPRVAVFSLDDPLQACAQIRLIQPLRHAGWAIEWSGSPLITDIRDALQSARNADLVVIQRAYAGEDTEAVVRSLVRSQVPLVFDWDDNLVDIPRDHPHYHSTVSRSPYIKWVLNEADLVTVSTPVLKRETDRHTVRPVLVQPNMVSWALFDALPRERDDIVRALVSGSRTHRGDWALLEAPLRSALTTHAGRLRAVFFGDVPDAFVGHPYVDVIPFVKSYQEYSAQLKSLQVHFALVPLVDSRFNQSKSNIKWLEYSAAGVPGVFSDVAPYRTSVTNGENGLLVQNSYEAWRVAIDHMMVNPVHARQMVESSRRSVFHHHSLECRIASFVEPLMTVLARSHRRGFMADRHVIAVRARRRAKSLLDRHLLWRFNR